MKTEKRDREQIRRGDFVKHSKGWYMVYGFRRRDADTITITVVFANGETAALILYGDVDAAPRGEVPTPFTPFAMRTQASKLRREATMRLDRATLLAKMAADLP